MRKKSLRLIATICLLVLFAGCTKAPQPEQTLPAESIIAEPETTAPTVPETEPINRAAVDFLLLLYPNDNTVTAVDYLMLDYFQTDDGSYYKVNWTVDVSEDLVKIVPNEDGTVTVDVNELCQEDTPYVLTASIATAEGYRLTHSWNHILPKYKDMVAIVEEAYQLSRGEHLPGQYTLTGRVSSIEKQWSEDYKNVTLTIRVEGCENKPIRCYSLVGEGVENIVVGDIITVTGRLQNFSSRIEFDSGCKLDNPEPEETTEEVTEEITEEVTEAVTQ